MSVETFPIFVFISAFVLKSFTNPLKVPLILTSSRAITNSGNFINFSLPGIAKLLISERFAFKSFTLKSIRVFSKYGKPFIEISPTKFVKLPKENFKLHATKSLTVPSSFPERVSLFGISNKIGAKYPRS